jgi:hypothetical protein
LDYVGGLPKTLPADQLHSWYVNVLAFADRSIDDLLAQRKISEAAKWTWFKKSLAAAADKFRA